MRAVTQQSARCAAMTPSGRYRCHLNTGHAGQHETNSDTERRLVWPNDTPPDALEMPLFDRRRAPRNAIQEGR